MKWLIFILTAVAILILSCSNQASTENNEQINYLSKKEHGCISQKRMTETDNDVDFSWSFNNNNLQLNFFFPTHCSAQCSDSVKVNDNSIVIMLEDTCSDGSRCICRIKEEFNFQVVDCNQLNIDFYYKAYASDNYYTLVDTLINL